MKERMRNLYGLTAISLGIVIGLAVLIAAEPAAAAKTKAVNPLSGKGLAELAKLLKSSPDESVRVNAVNAIAESVPAKRRKTDRPSKTPDPAPVKVDARVVAALVGGLSDKASGVRYACREALGRCGAMAVGPLVASLSSKNDDVRSYAADALGDMGVYFDADAQPLDQAVPALTKLLDDKDYVIRVSAARTLAKIGPRAKPAMGKLTKLLDDPEWSVAEAAVEAVADVDPNGTKCVPALAAVLQSKKHDIRELTCSKLGEMGAKAEAAVPALIELLDADAYEWYAGKAAAMALGAIVSADPKNADAPKVPDETRTIVLAAIAKSVAAQKTPFAQDDRLAALLPSGRQHPSKDHYEGELGPEVLPALPVALHRMQTWVKNRTPWVPTSEVIAFVGEVGVHAPDKVVGVVKELLADKNIDAKYRKQLEGVLAKLTK